jgi:hypothetical protein
MTAECSSGSIPQATSHAGHVSGSMQSRRELPGTGSSPPGPVTVAKAEPPSGRAREALPLMPPNVAALPHTGMYVILGSAGDGEYSRSPRPHLASRSIGNDPRDLVRRYAKNYCAGMA